MRRTLARFNNHLLGCEIRAHLAFDKHRRRFVQKLRSENGDVREVIIIAVAVVLLIILLKWGKLMLDWIKQQFGSETGAPSS